MTKSKKLFKKRRFRGNQYTNSDCVSSVSDVVSSVSSPQTPRPNEAEQQPSQERRPKQDSASKRKIEDVFDNDEDWTDVGEGNIIVNTGLISKAISSFCVCKFCHKENSLQLIENTTERKGLACSLSLLCENCNKEQSFYTSSKVDKFFDINLRCVYGLRAIGKGMIAGRTLFGLLDLPSPPQKFERYNGKILQSLKEVATDSMISATNEAVQLNVDEEGNTSTDLSIGIDGTWQKRGYSSLNGVVTVSCIDTGKILDAEVFSKYCHSCACKKDQAHTCEKNYEGSSGGMEVEGARAVFARSEASRGVRYKFYMGDGDSKGFDQVVASKPYGDGFEIKKLECVGHVQKRIGGRLRQLRRDYKKVKLRDGKRLCGAKGRLTDEAIDTLQNYYGLAIRRNKNNLEKMKKEVWATFYHKVSSNEKPQHHLCDVSWCKYLQAERDEIPYNHKNKLDEAVGDIIKPVYKALADPNLLKKCLHGRTQNVNESYNAVLWSRIPKTNFVGRSTLQFGTYDSIITYNEGNKGRLKVIKHLGLQPGKNCLKILTSVDKDRVRKAEIACLEEVKQKRKRARFLKKKKRDEEKRNEPEYEAGMF